MAKMKGTIVRNELEGGFYQFIAEDGTAYELEGNDPLLSRDGAKVELDGTVDRQAMSITMSGPRLKVTSVRALP
jgi:hypothetical protein